VQGPGRASGNGKILIDYVNGKLPVFVDVYISVVDIADTVTGHLLAAERGCPGARYVLNGATVEVREALEILTEVTGVHQPVRMAPAALARGVAAIAEGRGRLRGKTSSMCRARMRTILHGHRYDGSRATRELGLEYTPLAETFRRTIDWARGEGLIRQEPAPGQQSVPA
jgi:dihydroflavonol-4-reductase